jgi:hypothetical protein
MFRSDHLRWWEGVVLGGLLATAGLLPVYAYDGLTWGECGALLVYWVGVIVARFQQSKPNANPLLIWAEGVLLAGALAAVAGTPEYFEDGHLDAVEWGGIKTAFWGAVLATIRVTPPPPWRPGDAERRGDS